MPTVIIGSARDIVEHCGVPRFVFTEFPLGNPCGHPWQPQMQKDIVAMAIRLLATAATARTTEVAPFAWKDDPGWRERYGRVDPAQVQRLQAAGQERRRRQTEQRQRKDS